MKYFVLSAALALSACAASSSGWSAAAWNGLPDRTVAGGNYSFFAAPVEGQGFKLKFSVKTDGSFGVASAPTEDALLEAASAAAPEGCTLATLERTPDGGAVADYACD
ncbi:hypothetical protein HY29_01615 [Hyphomonas beringensis]|uniref:Lipoprotein n=1 Tax=Hyphomonas beringensis TaxID=1280946 RepID=A0A062UE91_9PROT|nr:hypothetical protein [Hyphomonas beringensis]KCZ54929.1 hypothetical protein HY29_01615 [Hyphomonas beringensis]